MEGMAAYALRAPYPGKGPPCPPCNGANARYIIVWSFIFIGINISHSMPKRNTFCVNEWRKMH